MSTMIVRLVELGLVMKRVDDKELRSNLLTLSRRGHSLLHDIDRLWAEADREIEATIGSQKTQELTGLTLQLRNALGGFTPGDERERQAARSPKAKKPGASRSSGATLE
jgi:DNA-binding MarR family transcriptional regulator